MKDFVKRNEAFDFEDEQWSQLIAGNGLLIMWFVEWINREWHKIPDMSILEFFTRKYKQTSGSEPYPMGGKVTLDGKYVSRDDDDLEPYFMIDTPDGVGYIYPYAFVALPRKKGGHTVVRMD